MRSSTSGYHISLQGRQEGLEYRDASDVYRFDVLLRGTTWEVYLPCVNKRLVGHIVLLISFVLAAEWSVDRLLAEWASDRDTGMLVTRVLATLGFISLSIQELRVVARARRSGGDDARGGGASARLH